MKMRSIIVGFIAIIIVTFQSADAAVHVVGDGLGWQLPPNSTYYANWASARNFTIGDTLVFNFTTGSHDVATVTLDDYNDCDTDDNLNITNNGPANFTLTANATQYYICTFPGHCSRGQKLAVNVGGTTTTPSSPSPPGSGITPATPPADSASTTVAANVALMMIMSLVVFFV